uniref:NADH-ubiquinone oxidoreductase chain 4 n=1 Tax=Tetraphleps aterrimus TaxID=452413 RepID=A0A4D6NYI2_9HEMI|nr:NADH dehydrogenase subunit 4 [Tetraphleps aterrimus]QCE31843.1 NADH dehydrogenase subunit 4 [Tetraphleps aterrimus]
MMVLFLNFIFMIPICIMGYWWELVLFFCLSLFFLMFIWGFDYYSFISYSMGVDLLSLSLIMLSLLILILMLMASFKTYLTFSKFDFMLVCMIMTVFLILSFSTTNLFLFYMFFEASLIPTLLLIFGWGYQPERLSAGFYLLFYTLFASLPLLIMIFYTYNLNCSLFYFMIYDLNLNFYIYLFYVLAFLIKLPIIMFHFWLPKAHVEAPVSGSMILAGILLKLGGYGLMRVMLFLNSFSLKYNYVFISISLYGMSLVGILCMMQYDIKSIIAYSSVAHMGLVICGIFTLNILGVYGSLVMMIGHGLCSSGMFSLANIIYERSHSRSIMINKGLIVFMPSMSLMWFLLMANNMSSPPSLNLLGEIMLINSVMSWSTYSFLFLCLSSFFSCCYSIYLYSITQHGFLYSSYFPSMSGSIREFLLIMMHWFPLNMLIMKSDLFIYWI